MWIGLDDEVQLIKLEGKSKPIFCDVFLQIKIGQDIRICCQNSTFLHFDWL